MACDEIDLIESLEDMTTADRVLVAAVLDTMTGFQQARGVAAWALWWAWKCHQILGDRPATTPQPPGMPASEIPVAEQLELRDELVRLVVKFEHRAGLRDFAIRLCAELLRADLDRQGQRADLERHFAEQRRKRPHGDLTVPHDHTGIAPWSEASRPPNG